MWDFLGSIFGEGAGLGGIFARVAVAFGLMRFITGLTNKNNTTTTVVDNRIQVAPATTNKIPVAYGASYFNGTIFDIELTNNNQSLWAAIALCETTGNLYSTGSASSIHIDAIYLDNKLITFKSDGTTVDYTTDDTGVQDTNPSGLIGIYLYQGNSSSPMLPVTPGTTTAISGTVPPAAYSIMPGWSNTYMAENLIFAIVKLNYDQSKGQHTIPNLKFHVVNNMNLPGDCLYDYMVNDLYGASIDPSLINTSSIAALNTYSSQSVTYGAYPAQQRYAINGLIDTTNKVLDNMDKIAATAGSYITYDVATGKWSVLIQQVVSQTFSFGDHNIIGQISATGTALDSYYNAVELQFPYAYYRDQNNYIRIDLPSQDLDYNEPINVLKLQHDLINNQVQAAIIGNIMLRQSREDLAVEFKTDFSSYNLQVGDVFGLTNSTYGFTNRQFRVIKLIKSEDEKGELTIAVTGLSYNPDVYTVDTIDQFTPLLGTSTNPNLAAIQTPDAPTVVGSTVSSQPSMTVTATVPAGVVTDMEFWASSDGTNYTFQGSTRSLNSGPFATGSTTSFKSIELLTATWYWKVRAGNVQGTSQFSAASTGFAFTYTQAPDVLPSNTPITNSSGGGLTGLEGLGLGIIGAYVASQINWQGLGNSILSGLESAGILDSSTVASIQSNLNKQFTGGTTAGTGINVSSSGVVSLNANLNDLNDVNSSSPTSGQVLTWNGTYWIPETNSSSNVQKMDDLTDADTTTVTPLVGDYLYWDGTNWRPDRTETGPGGSHYYQQSPAPTDVCEIGGYIAVGSISVPTVTDTNLSTCGGNQQFTVAPDQTSTSIGATYSSKTGPTGGYYYITVTFSSTTAPTGNWLISAGNPSANGLHTISSSTSTSATIRYTYNPGTISSGTYFRMDKPNGTGSAPRIYGLKSLIIKNNIASSYTLVITPSVGCVSWSPNQLNSTNYIPNSSSGITDGPNQYGNSNNPLSFTGSYNAINTILQGKLNWCYNSAWTDYTTTVSIPPSSTSVTISYALTANGVTKTHTETLTYVSYSTMYPLDKQYTVS